MKAHDQVAGDLLIRNCKIGDLSDVERIEKASFDDPYTAIIFWSIFLDPKVFFRVGVMGDSIIGYSIVKLENEKESKKAHLISIAIDPKHRRKGFGDKLLQDAIKVASHDTQVRRMILEVKEDNQTAIELYKRFSFVRESVITGYYSDGKNALIYSLDLL